MIPADAIERAARAMEPGAFATFDAGYTNRNAWDERAFLNAEKVVRRARRKAQAALQAALGDGVVVPREPTPAMLDSAVAFALNVTISGKYNWSAYMRNVYRTMLRAAPPASKPKQGGVHGA